MTAVKPDTTLDALRREIDEIDTQILDLLVRRFAATGRVKATKSHDGSIASSPFRPAREAAMLRRLIAAGGRTMPPDLLVRLWRVILSASIQFQAPIILHVDEGLAHDLATRLQLAQHFCGMKVEPHRSPAHALDALRARRGDLAIIATSSDWTAGFSAAEAGGAQIIGTLPVIANDREPPLLVFGHAEPQASGDDETLVLVSESVPSLASALWLAQSGSCTLVSLPGFLGDDDTLLREMLARFSGAKTAGRCPRPIRV